MMVRPSTAAKRKKTAYSKFVFDVVQKIVRVQVLLVFFRVEVMEDDAF